MQVLFHSLAQSSFTTLPLLLEQPLLQSILTYSPSDFMSLFFKKTANIFPLFILSLSLMILYNCIVLSLSPPFSKLQNPHQCYFLYRNFSIIFIILVSSSVHSLPILINILLAVFPVADHWAKQENLKGVFNTKPSITLEIYLFSKCILRYSQ